METKMIGNRIAEARKKLNVSQAELAERLFISAQAVGKWERGESFPDITTFIRLAKLLGVDLNYFSDDFPSTASENNPEHFSEKPAVPEPAGKPAARTGWDMSRGNWADADFSGLSNLHDKFSASNLQRCLFVGSDLSQLLLKGNNVDRCDFSDSNFSHSRIQRTNLSGNVFKNCSLTDAEISESYVSGCDFTNADFTGTVIQSGGFEKSILEKAVWNNTRFTDALLADVVFNSPVDHLSFENCAFTRVTFQNLQFSNTFFKCKSLKRIRFIDCQADRMTYAFLKNGKADLNGVTLIQ